MDHAEAIRSSATERYLLGELAEDQRLAYEEHYFGCAECAEDVKAGAAFVANAREVLKAEPPERTATILARPRPAGWRGLFFPVPAGLAATLVVCAGLLAYQSLVVVPSLRREAEAPQPVRSAFLTISRAEPRVVTVSRRDRKLALRLSGRADRAFPSYRVELRDASGSVVEDGVVPAPPPGDEIEVLLSLSRLKPGAHVIVLAGLQAPGGPVTAPDLARYHFTLQYGEE
jgi:hypothetical protein